MHKVLQLPSSTLHSGFEVVHKVIQDKVPIPDVAQLSVPIHIVWDFCENHIMWENHNQAGDEQPTESTEPIHWREVGWIFRRGQCVAIERKGPEVRARMRVA